MSRYSLENCLEDTVSIFEAVLKAMLTRHLKNTGETEESIQKLFAERIRNGFQSPKRSMAIIKHRTPTELHEGFSEDKIKFLASTFAKRHPITHNLGVVDKKYLASAIEAEREGKEVRVTTEEIEEAIELSIEALSGLHNRLLLHTKSARAKIKRQHAMKKTFASQCNRCYIEGNTPATPLAPPCEEMTRTNGRFFIFISSGGWRP